MNRHGIYTWILLAASLAAGNLAAQDNPEFGLLRGTVRDAASGLPLRFAEVEAFTQSSTQPLAGSTDEDGAFALEVPPGRYYLVAHDDRFERGASQRYQNLPCVPGDCDVRQGTPVEVAAGEEVAGLLFELPAAGFIEGSVRRASDGSVVAETTVGIWNGTGSLVKSAPVRDGRFRSPGLPQGTYFVTVRDSAEDVGQLHGGGTCQSPPFGSAGCDVRQGTPVEVHAGTAEVVDFVLTPGAFLEGRVVGPAGERVEGSVEALDEEGRARRGTGLDEEGRYRIGPLAPGRHHLMVYTQDFPRQLYRDIVCFVFDCDLTRAVGIETRSGETRSGLDFRLHAFGSLAGTVSSQRTRAPIPRATVVLYLDSGQEHRRQYADENGRFQFEELSPGRYRIAALADGFDGRLYDGVPFPDPLDPAPVAQATPVLVPDGGSLAGIQLQLPESGRVDGRLVDAESGDPLPAAVVRAYRSGEDRPLHGVAADADGNFRLSLPAGTWYLVAESEPARSRLVGTAEGCPSNLNGQATCDPSRGQAFAIEVGRRLSAGTIEIGRAARLRGRIELEEAAPSVRVELYSGEGKWVRSEYLEYQDGAEFEFVVPPGRYHLEAAARYHANQLYGGVDCPGGEDDVFAYQCPDPRLGTPIEVSFGEERDGLDLQMHLDRSPCQPAALRLCLGGGRFAVAGTLGPFPAGIHYVQQLTRDAGIVPSLPQYPPALLKILDGCGLNGHFWLFASTGGEVHVRDRFAGVTRIYSRVTTDLEAFATCDVSAPATTPPAVSIAATPPPAENPCGIEEGEGALCLLDRFKVTARWQTGGAEGSAAPLAVDAGTGALSFFSADNLELVVRMYADCEHPYVPRFWVYATGATDVGFRLRVLDARSGVEKEYQHEAGQPFVYLEDLDAFATCGD